MCWLKDLAKIRQKLTFANNILLGTWKDNLTLYDFGCTNTFWNQKALKPTGNVRDENIKFVSAIRYLAIKSTQQVLTYFKSFCQSFHIPFSYCIFDQRYCFFIKKIFNRYIKKLWKSRNDWFLIYRLPYQSSVKIPSGKMSVLSHLDIGGYINNNGLYLLSF